MRDRFTGTGALRDVEELMPCSPALRHVKKCWARAADSDFDRGNDLIDFEKQSFSRSTAPVFRSKARTSANGDKNHIPLKIYAFKIYSTIGYIKMQRLQEWGVFMCGLYSTFLFFRLIRTYYILFVCLLLWFDISVNLNKLYLEPSVKQD